MATLYQLKQRIIGEKIGEEFTLPEATFITKIKSDAI